MKRRLQAAVLNDLSKKMVFLAGPRQCGKTTLALQLLQGTERSPRYVNWDVPDGRHKILEKSFPAEPGLLVLDEIHKYPRWRNLLKGLYDSRKSDLQILVTGSAKLDAYRRGGDSLQGRYHLLRMHPLAFWELETQDQTSLEKMLKLGGFPEPFLSGSEKEARRWSRTYRTRVIQEEVSSLEKVNDLTRLEELSMLLPARVGGVLSVNSVREDLGVSHVTANRWLTILENLYQVYRTIPFGSPRIKAIKKESKFFLYDWNLVDEMGGRFENMIGSHLLNQIHWVEDTEGYSMELRYFRDQEQREVDFVVLKDRKPRLFVECKLTRQSATPALKYLKGKFPEVPAVQVTLNSSPDEIDAYGIRHYDAVRFLGEIGTSIF